LLYLFKHKEGCRLKLVSHPAAFIGSLLPVERQVSFGGIAVFPALIQ